MNTIIEKIALHELNCYQLLAQYPDLTAIDYYLARSMFDELADDFSYGEGHGLDEALVFVSFLLLSQVLRDGHSCLLLSAFA